MASTRIALERIMSAGFAGIEIELFARKNAAAVFDDGKETLSKMVEALTYQKRLV